MSDAYPVGFPVLVALILILAATVLAQIEPINRKEKK